MTEKRKALTRRQVIELCLRQEGRCGCGCGFKLDPMGEGVIDEHFNPLGLTGTNDIENRRLFRKLCATEKTKPDKARIAKAKRQGGIETGQQARRARRDRPLIPSRPFQKSENKKPWPKGPSRWRRD